MQVKLSSSMLSTLSVAGCRNLWSLELACPSLTALHLDGCDRLVEAVFVPVGLRALNLGICPHLIRLSITAPQLERLDLRGCGALRRAQLCCERLAWLDASYCSQLEDGCVGEAARACPAIETLILAACPSVTARGLAALGALAGLTELDLSYTFLTDLAPVFAACARLRVLRLSACKYLAPEVLTPLHGARALPHLRELDVSYGMLGAAALEALLRLCPHLESVLLSGCAHVSAALFQHISLPPPPLPPPTPTPASPAALPLQLPPSQARLLPPLAAAVPAEAPPAEASPDVEMVKEESGAVRAPTVGQVAKPRGRGGSMEVDGGGSLTDKEPTSPAAATLPGGILESPAATTTVAPPPPPPLPLPPTRMLQTLSCVGCPRLLSVVIPADAACGALTTLNLSLAEHVREVRLACPCLATLNLSNCAALAALQLDCPRLTSLSLQGCGLDADTIERQVQRCPLLETLDVRNCTLVTGAVVGRIRGTCPWVRRLYSSVSG
eukprot:jgi/Mesen1/4569/ME000232S03814